MGLTFVKAGSGIDRKGGKVDFAGTSGMKVLGKMVGDR